MVTITIVNDDMKITVKGVSKLLALKSELTIPLKHVRGVTADAHATAMPKGFKVGGARIPGILYAGTFYQEGEKTFWDVHTPANAIVIELADEALKRLVVEVDDPASTVQLIESSLK